MVEDAKEEDVVELAEDVGGEVVDGEFVALALVFVVAEGFAAEVEGFPGVAVALVQVAEVVGEVVDGDHLFGSAFEGLECPVAVPGSDVENAFAGEVFGDLIGRGEQGSPAGGGDAAGEVDFVIPEGLSGDFFGERVVLDGDLHFGYLVKLSA